MFIYFFILLFYTFFNIAEINVTIDESVKNIMRAINVYGNQINIYSSDFYLQESVRINTNFMMGTSQKVIYLNYPFTFANDVVNNSMKNTNGIGIVVLKDQPQGTTTANLNNQKAIVPIAYFTVQDNPIGWSLYCPADYYQQEVNVTNISLYNNNIYIGKLCGPLHQPSSYLNTNIAGLLGMSGKYNVILGNNSGNYDNAKLLSYNTIVGSMSGNLLTGSFNSFFGDYHGSKTIINPNYLNQDYYSNDDFSNYNNSFGFGNYNLTHTTSQGLKFLANKQNNVFGNLNFSSIWRGYRNCIFGNRILCTIVDNITQFNWIDSNIMIGNNIFYQSNNNLIAGLYGNIILIPNGDQVIYGGLGLSEAFAPSKDNPISQSNYAIMIGSCGLPIPYPRSYKTFIANIYNTSLINSTVSLSTTGNPSAEKALDFIGGTSFPVTVMINNADQLGQMELLPYGVYKDNEIFNPNLEPGNVTDLKKAVECLLDPHAMPIIGVAFENTAAAAKNGLFFTVDVYSLMKNNTSLVYHPLTAFIIYTAVKTPVPYSSLNNKNNVFNMNYGVTAEPKVCGYEHYYLIPLLVRACQILNEKINSLIENARQVSTMCFELERQEYDKKIKVLLDQQEMIIDYLMSENKNKNILKKIKLMCKKSRKKL